MISEVNLIPKIYARLQEIASNFSKISGGDPQTLRRRSRLRRSVQGFAPLPAPLSKIPGSAPVNVLDYLVLGAMLQAFLVFTQSRRPFQGEKMHCSRCWMTCHKQRSIKLSKANNDFRKLLNECVSAGGRHCDHTM